MPGEVAVAPVTEGAGAAWAVARVPPASRAAPLAALTSTSRVRVIPRQLDVRRRALQLMEQAVSAGLAGPRELAFLRDRTRANEGRRQVYGTQIAVVKDGAPIPWPCEEPERVDELRAEVGIEPFDEYVSKFATT
ncbi:MULTISPECIES: DUF6624 domain-containing protein [unclassified Streptomyces]|uniref:DUF6624 domain-containing protein n=1 Tax=Streptomyces sp. NPDC055082 TaxID=3365718 RepID=UPI0037CD96B3